MEKQTLIRRIQSTASGSGMINIKEIAAFNGCDPDSDCRKKITGGLDYISNGREKLFFVDDIAQRMLELRKV